MVTSNTISGRIFDILNTVLLTLLMIVSLYPFWYITVASISNANEFMVYKGILYKPLGFSLEAYKAVFKNPSVFTGYKNTIIYVVLGTAFNIIMTSLGAYALSRKNFFWKKPVTAMILLTMFFHGGLIPSYLLIQSIGLVNNPLVMIIPGAVSTWNLIIMRTAFCCIPQSLEEAAKIDGANDLFILFRVTFPLALPTIAVITLYYGVSHWNAWFNAMIYLNNRDLFPLQLFLREILISNSMENMLKGVVTEEKEMISETIKYATIIVATLPILAAYPFLQKYFVKGVMIGAVKG